MKTRNNEFLHLSDKLDILDQRLDEMDILLTKQEVNLSEHMKRTKLLEDIVTPLNKFMWGAMGIVGFVTFMGIIAGIFMAVK